MRSRSPTIKASRRSRPCAAILLWLGVAAGPAAAQLTATAEGDAAVNISQAASITVVGDVVRNVVLFVPTTNFTSAVVVSGSSVQAQTVSGVSRAAATNVLSRAPVATTTAQLSASSLSTAQAVFTVAGDGSQSISVAVPETLTLSRLGGGETVRVTTETDVLGSTGSQLAGGALGGNGALSFNVGGTVNVNDNVVPGDYAGLLIVMAQYN